MFKLIAAQDGDAEWMSREELEAAHNGDDTFQDLPAGADGNVALADWLGFLEKTTMAGTYGPKWLPTILQMLRENVEAQAGPTNWDEILEECSAVYTLLAAVDGNTEELTKKELLDAHGD